MLTEQDYRSFLQEIFAIEVTMEREALELQEAISAPEAQVLLAKLVDDERRHQRIVQALLDLLPP
jgi:rubrerythrin